jgi:DNA-binding MarR family transcriptional regulator
MQSSQELAFELQNVIGQLRRSKTLKHDCSNLKGAEKHVLFLIYELKNSRPITISEIANKFGVTPAAVTHQINTLEKQGLVKRLSDSGDRRVVLIELTKNGRTQVAKLKKEFAKKTQILAGFLGEKDTKDLIRLVKKMSEFRALTPTPESSRLLPGERH